jgi:virulence-associated protein VagC
MALTRAFKCGDDQAIRIPAELAYEDMTVEFSTLRDMATSWSLRPCGPR